MILEMRTYQIQAGKAPEFLKIYQANGLHIITRYARLIGCWTKESGVLNSVVSFGPTTILRTEVLSAPRWPKTQSGWRSCPRSCLILCIRKVYFSILWVFHRSSRATDQACLHRCGAVTMARKMHKLIVSIWR